MAGDVILRRIVDVDIGIGAVVLHRPADVREPERELGLSHRGAVDQRMARIDADHAAPGALADERADLHQLEAVREDVAVGAGVLVGERDQRAEGGVGRVGVGLFPPREVVADALARELLEQELRDVTAAVVAHVDDHGVALALNDEVAMELGEARRHHVGQVQVADAALRLLVHPAAVALHPVAVTRRHFVFQQRDEGAAFVFKCELDLGAGLMHEQ